MTPEEYERAILYGICPYCNGSRDVRTTEEPNGDTMISLVCPTCEAPQ